MLSKPITKILSDPLAYPFEVSDSSFSIRKGVIEAGPVPVYDQTHFLKFKDILRSFLGNRLGETEILNPVGFMTCGSNASPNRLVEKLNAMAVNEVYALRISMTQWIPVYAATVSYYGSVPATFEYIDGWRAEPFLLVMDRLNLAAIVESEQRSGNYHTYRVPGPSLAIDTDIEVFAFVSKYGALMRHSQPVPVREFLAHGKTDTWPDQAKLVTQLLSEVGMSLPSLSRYKECVKDQSFVQEFRNRVNKRYARSPNVPGWEKANL